MLSDHVESPTRPPDFNRRHAVRATSGRGFAAAVWPVADLARSFAKLGFLAIAPERFERQVDAPRGLKANGVV
ncbi:MAG: hypothetical protein ABI671_20100 [Burkholderiales bacterium]